MPMVRGDAYVYKSREGFCVLFVDSGEAYDHAEFDEELEAVEAARRGVYGIGTVHVGASAPWEML